MSEWKCRNMSKKLPYYMAYPLPLQYDDERIERRDYEYMQSLYPEMAKKVLPYVEEECDRMEYKCSMMYDEYPDKLQLRMMSNRVFREVLKNEKVFYGEEHKELDWLKDLIEVMLYNELHRRRCDYRRCIRRIY